MKNFDSPRHLSYGLRVMTSVVIYQDYVHNNGALYKALCTLYDPADIGFIDADDILNGALGPQIKAFIMPGGASRYVSDKLDGKGNACIKNYIANGGAYIGICAGAYYACRRTEWKPGFDQRFMVDNELGFFPGIAKGPVQEFVSVENPEHMACITQLATTSGETLKSFYWGGPVFVSDAADEFQILAHYADLPGSPPAVVEGVSGKGKYLLFSSHPEVDTAQLQHMTFNVADNRYGDIAGIKEIDGVTLDFFQNTLKNFIG